MSDFDKDNCIHNNVCENFDIEDRCVEKCFDYEPKRVKCGNCIVRTFVDFKIDSRGWVDNNYCPKCGIKLEAK
jgi:hypothetical protein